jgi:hypothetical protein
MSFDFDLNIYNYTISELEKFLGLSDGYTFNDVLKNCKDMSKVIMENRGLDREKKVGIISFMESAKENLVKRFKKPAIENSDGFIEDPDKLLIYTDEKNVVNQTSTTYAGHSFVMNRETNSLNKTLNKAEYLNPIETYPTNIARSMLNNLKRKTICQTVILNSMYREDYLNTSPSDFSIVLPYQFKNVLSVRLSSVQLPNVIYCISKQNKTNFLYIFEETTQIEGTVEIPDGNYGACDFVAVLESAINTQLATGTRFTVGFDAVSGKLTIANSVNAFSMTFLMDADTNYIAVPEYRQINSVAITEVYKKLGWIMGYRKAEYNGESSYTTEGIYNGASAEYIYFVLNDFNKSQSQNIIGMFSRSLIGDNILAMIPLTSDSFNVCFDNGADFIEKKREYFGPVNIQRLKIQLLNQFGEVVDLNNMDFSFSLEMELGYDW